MLSRRTLLTSAAGVTLFGQEDPRAPLGGGMELYYGPKWDKPFVYPLRSVGGVVVSRGYPLEPRAGEASDHAWHRGIWYGHGIINGQDFWRELGREKTARLVASAPPKVGSNHLELHTEMVAPGERKLGTIVQEYRLADAGKLRRIDVRITIAGAPGLDLTFGDTDDGGFGFRLADEFREDKGAVLRNSEGGMGSKQIWGKNARWVDYEAKREGAAIGVSLFDHPSNLRYPTGWHARGYSLCSANPFAAHSFDKSAPDGSYTLPAGKRLTLRYRLLIREGAFSAEATESQFRDWARA